MKNTIKMFLLSCVVLSAPEGNCQGQYAVMFGPQHHTLNAIPAAPASEVEAKTQSQHFFSSILVETLEPEILRQGNMGEETADTLFANHFTVYPVPANTYFNIEAYMPSEASYTLRIVDHDHRVKYARKMGPNASRVKVPVYHWAAGVYLVIIELTNGEVYLHRVVVRH